MTDIRLLTKPEVQKTVKMSGSNIYRLMSLGQFPKPIKVGTGAVRWVESEIQGFLRERIEARG